MSDTRIKNSSRNIAWGFLDRITAIIFPFIVRTIFIKVLGEEYLGLGTLFTSILQVINLTDLGFATAVSAELYKPIAYNQLDRVGELLYIFDKIYKWLGCVILVIGLCTTPFLPLFISGEIPTDINIYFLWIIYLMQVVAGYVTLAYKTTLLSALQRSDISSGVAAVTRTIISVVQIALVIVFHNIYLYAALNLIYTLVYNLACAYSCSKKFGEFKIIKSDAYGYMKKITKDIFALALQKIGNTLSISLDSVIISAFLGLSIVAIYGNYYYVISAIVILISLIVTSITASIGDSIAVSNIEKNYSDFIKIFLLHGWIVGWCAICFVVLFNTFMELWMGEDLLFSVPIIIALVVRFYVEQIRRVVLNYRDAAGLWVYDKWKPIFGCSVNVVLNIILVRYFGVIGVAISTIVDFAIIELPWETRTLFKQYFKKSPMHYYRLLAFISILTVFNGAITYWICGYLGIKGVVAFWGRLLVCFLITNILFYFELRMIPEFKLSIDLVKKSLGSSLK